MEFSCQNDTSAGLAKQLFALLLCPGTESWLHFSSSSWPTSPGPCQPLWMGFVFLAVCKHHPSQCPSTLVIHLATVHKVKVQALPKKKLCTKALLVLAVRVGHQKYLTETGSSWGQTDRCLFMQQQHPGSSRRVQSWHWRHRASNKRWTGKSAYREWALMSYIPHSHQQTGK